MKKQIFRRIAFCLLLFLILPVSVQASRQEKPLSLSGYIQNSEKRHFAEAMLNYHLVENTMVRDTLENGYSAVFFFDGCSDNMDDPELSDLSYYRVSGVCIAVKRNDRGEPVITYFDPNCSTLPDRPLDYGTWNLEEVGDVGPATVCDGTYELYSVYHAGSYEALHIRTSCEDETVSAVYMTPEGFVPHPATYINIHTRTGNHALKEAMWSAGCILVGNGQWTDFANLIAATYYSNYGTFSIGQKVGCVTINRQYLREDMVTLYENWDAVDAMLVSSRCESPEIYLQRCTENTTFFEKTVQATGETQLMSLPCGMDTDARSIPVTTLKKGDKIDICGSIVNTLGELWYEVSFFGENCYVPGKNVADVPPSFFEKVLDFFRF